MHIKKIHHTIYKRLHALALAGVMTLTLLAEATPLLDGIAPFTSGTSAKLTGMPSKVYATSSAEETTEEAKETTEEAKENVNSAATVLKDTHGRIVLWKWEKVTQSNVGNLINDDKFHPSMLVRMDSSGNYKGFISTFADEEHVYRGYDNGNYPEKFNKLEQSSRDAHGSKVEREIGLSYCYNQYSSFFIKLDNQGNSLNDAEVFGQDVFYTNGSNMGVPYIRAKRIGNTLRTKLKDRNTFRVDASIVLARASAAKDPNDVSFYEVMDGTLSDDDYFLEKWWYGSGGEKNEPYLYITPKSGKYYTPNYEFCLQPFGAENGGRGDTWVIKADLNEEEDPGLDGLDYAIADDCQGKYGDQIDGFSTTLLTKGGYLLAMDVRRAGGNGPVISANSYGIGLSPYYSGRNIYDVKVSGAECRFTWYVGTPYTFASLVGQGGDSETGEHGTTIIGKGELLEINNAEYMDVNNRLQRSDGLILPESAKIIINEGGVLSVTTNLINNGKIINNGGTIIIKEGGCISPFLDTNEGVVECRNGGNIVVMPEGRLFCLSDIYMKDVDLTTLATQNECSLKLTGGSTLINYGLFANSFCQIDKSSIIENRGKGVIMAAVKRKNINKLLYNAELKIDGDYTTVEGLEPIDGYGLAAEMTDNYIMFYGITCPQSYSGTFSSLNSYSMDDGGTIRCDRTATFVRYIYSEKYKPENDTGSQKWYFDAVRLVDVEEPDY